MTTIIQTLPAGQKVVYVVVLGLWVGLFYLANRARRLSETVG